MKSQNNSLLDLLLDYIFLQAIYFLGACVMFKLIVFSIKIVRFIYLLCWMIQKFFKLKKKILIEKNLKSSGHFWKKNPNFLITLPN
jgi:hypothetical protein